MNYISFSLAFLSVFLLLSYYIYKRFIKKLHLSSRKKHYLTLLLLLNYLGIVGYMFARYYFEAPNWLYFLFSIPIGILFLLFCTTIFYDISGLLLQAAPLSERKREFFKKSLDTVSLAGAALLAAKSIYNAKYIEIQKVDIKIKNLKKSYKIAQLSDLHIGGLIDKAFIEKIVTKTNALCPDVVVITGDLIDVSVKKAAAALNELTKLKSKYGIYYIVGNHEYFHDIEEIITYVKSMGIKVLENESVYITDGEDGFHLAGVYDIMGYRVEKYIPDLQKALENTHNAPTVLLAHQPKFAKWIYEGVDLMLCGHTHGGQIYPFRFLVGLDQPYISGLHKHNDKMQVYVNRGTGFWGPPMRLGSSSEISDITIFS